MTDCADSPSQLPTGRNGPNETAHRQTTLVMLSDGPAAEVYRPRSNPHPPDDQGNTSSPQLTERTPLILVCEHASNRIPHALGDLGLTTAARTSHVAWDPGAFDVARYLADDLAAPLVFSRFSRLVYDCNRHTQAPDAIPEISESIIIPGNMGLTPDQREARQQEIYQPFCAALDHEINAHLSRGIAPIILTIHSFTPIYHGQRRNVQLGIVHDSDARFADVLLACAVKTTELTCARNEPYSSADGVTHTLRQHAVPHQLLNAMIEIRNDLITSPATMKRMANLLTKIIKKVTSQDLQNPSPVKPFLHRSAS